MMTMNIFVYGTLKRGFPNYNPAQLEPFYCDDCTTLNRYSLVVADQYYAPVLLLDDANGVGQPIRGELYQVDQPTLEWLDKLEGIGKNKGYQRITIEVLTNAGEIKTAEAYMKHSKEIDVIHTQLGTFYPLDKRYIPPFLRDK